MSKGREFRELLKGNNLIILPGAFDCITARLIEQAGFSGLYMTGAGTCVSRLGLPDYGLATLLEMADNAGCIASAVNIPLIADADTGFGNELNTIRTVHEYERRGVAGIHIEDQTFPKKCGHLSNKEVLPINEFISKIKAAVQEKNDPDFIIIARTDAIAVNGLNDAITRANEAFKVGADIAFLEAPQTIEEIKAIPTRVNGPCLFNYAPGGQTPDISFEEVEKAGYKLAIVPGIMLQTVIISCRQALKYLIETNEHPPIDSNLTIKEMFRILGSDQWNKKF